jgi:hypothetical protein
MTAETSVSFDISIRRYDGDQKEDIARNKITMQGDGVQVIEGELTTDDGDPPNFGMEFNLSTPPMGLYIVVDHPVDFSVKIKNGNAWEDFYHVPLERMFLYAGAIGDFSINNPFVVTNPVVRYKIIVVK